MARVLRLFIFLLAFSALTSAAHAEFDESRAWFEGLSEDRRNEVQSNLTLLGHYTFLVDGQFGRGTYTALLRFQRTRRVDATGVLAPADLEALDMSGRQVHRQLGLKVLTDEAGRSTLVVPSKLLSEATHTPRGTAYAAPDGSVVLETSYRTLSDQSFSDLFDEFSGPGEGRTVTYSNFNPNRFVITGEEQGRKFYILYRSDGSESVGFNLNWAPARDQTASAIAVYVASNFTPLYATPAAEAPKVTASTSELRRFGAWSLPSAEPGVIVLNGEIVEGTAADFFRALRARPEAEVVVLNSPGGYVDSALVVAREVFRRGMATLVSPGDGCYSACAYIYFAGLAREVRGELGVHQISAEVADLVFAQTTLSDVIDALTQFGVAQVVIVEMLRTPPDDMYIFSEPEIRDWQINRGTLVADLGNRPAVPPRPAEPPRDAGVAFVHLSQANSGEEAERSLRYVQDRWAGVLGNTAPEIARSEQPQGVLFQVRVPVRSVESANAMCAAIKQAGGGCYVQRS